jgi:energy-coupling factor transport system permease protein
MAFDIAIGQYHHAESILHRIDPRCKVTLLFVFMATVFLADTFIGMGVLVLFLLFIIAISNIKLWVVFKAFLPLSFLLIFPLLFNIFFIQTGTPLVHWGVILITDEGISRACFMTLRLFLLFLSATLLTLTTSPISLCDATASMLHPFERFGVPAYEISMMISIALRFVPTLMEDFEHIRKAQQSRGAVFDRGGPIARIKSIVPCLVPLFAQSFRHAENLALAMESRCYHGGDHRTHYHILKFAPRDAVATLVCIVLFVVMLVWL